MSKDEWVIFTVRTLDAARLMMKGRDRQPHEEAIYTAVRHCIDECPAAGKMAVSEQTAGSSK
jgi:hypothetical protein